jgi:hypothetical protein
MASVMLSTVDNPYNPFTHFQDWYNFDTRAGYHTTSFLARIVNSSDELSEPDQERAIEFAIDEIVKENILGLYVKVVDPNIEGDISEPLDSFG